jgi:methionyl-tRNA formyltransferase
MKIAFAGSRDLAVKIINWIDQKKDYYDIEIVGGIAPQFKGWWNDQVENEYKKLNIPIYSNLEEMISVGNPDIIFSLNYWKIIPEKQIKKLRCGIINIHHSYKLRFRGRYSTSWAIIHARKDNNWVHGTTIHYIDKNLDNGKIIASEKCIIEKDDTAESLFIKVEQLAFNTFKKSFQKIIDGPKSFIQPDPTFYYYGKDSKKDFEIDSSVSNIDLEDFIRAWTFKDRALPLIRYKNKKLTYEEYKKIKSG